MGVSSATQPERQIQLDTVLLKLSSRCNIDCTYCYVYHMGDDNWSRLDKVMSIETIDASVKSLAKVASAQNKSFAVVLHGGEPLLIGPERLHYLFDSLRAKLPPSFPVSMQTNGILLTDEILNICSEYKVSVSVSIDGPKVVNDASRIDHRREGTFDRVMRGIERLSAHRDSDFLYAGLLAVIDTRYSPQDIYSFFKDIKAPSVDFLYRDGHHTCLPFGKSSVHSIEYGSWMLKLAACYVNDPSPVPIRVIDDMFKVLLGGTGTKEGMGVAEFGIAIIDTDGSITKNDTLKSSGTSADQFENTWNVKTVSLVNLLQSEEFEHYYHQQKPRNNKCRECPYLSVCGGGMLTHRWSEKNGFDNPTIYCSDQMYLIEGLKEILEQHGL